MLSLRQRTEVRAIGYGVAASICAVMISILCWPMPRSLQHPVAGTLTLLDVRGREIAQIASPEARVQLPRNLKEMGPWLAQVTVALEDHRFYQHHGFDWHAAAAALARNVKSGRIVSGGSTITQQLAKLARGRQHRSWLGKIDETVVAWKLERRWSKQRILAEYLNRNSYGNRRLGPEAAARAYFGKSARDLTLAESIFLAGLPQAPTRFNPWTHSVVAARRYERSVDRLGQLGVITAEQCDLLAKSQPTVQRFDPMHAASHFVDAVRAEHPTLRGTISTSLDLDLQALAEQLVGEHLKALNRYDIAQAALVIVDNETGAVRAMVG
jgi:penicillin-binding protein 1C